MRAVDTNVLVRLIARDDPQQVAAADAYIEKGASVSTIVLAETCWVLASVYGLSGNQIATVVDMLLRHERLSLQDAEVVSAALAQFRAAPSPGFTDCLILEVARKAGHLPLGTFDRRLGKANGTERL